jgi:hypothetical protein
MRNIVAAAIVLSLAVPAYAQMKGPIDGGAGKPGVKSKEQLALEKKEEEKMDRAHKKALSRVPDRAPPRQDPWASIR